MPVKALLIGGPYHGRVVDAERYFEASFVGVGGKIYVVRYEFQRIAGQQIVGTLRGDDLNLWNTKSSPFQQAESDDRSFAMDAVWSRQQSRDQLFQDWMQPGIYGVTAVQTAEAREISSAQTKPAKPEKAKPALVDLNSERQIVLLD